MPSRYRPADQNAGTARDTPTSHGADLDWGTAIGYYGFAQVFGLGVPVLWLAFQSPTEPGLLGPVALTACAGGVFFLAAGRKHVLVGERWPTLTNRKLGTGTGYWAFLRRHAHVSATLALATFGGVLAGRLVGVHGGLGTAAVGSAAGVALVPRFASDDRPAGLARGGFYAAGLTLTVVVARPLDLSVAVTSAPVVFLFLAVAAAADVLVAPPGTDPRT